MISENDSYYHTNKKGIRHLIQPFGPDLVHTPPDNDLVTNKIFEIKDVDKEKYSIPKGLKSIDSMSFTKLSFHFTELSSMLSSPTLFLSLSCACRSCESVIPTNRSKR